MGGRRRRSFPTEGDTQARHLARLGRGRGADEELVVDKHAGFFVNATGVRVRDYPITLDNVPLGLPNAA